ncbi:hypothetical protein ABH948_003098 [Bacillus sp. RC218]
MRHYFIVVAYYRQNGELFESSHWFETKDNLQEVMEASSGATKRAYEKAFTITSCDLISIQSREVSEFEYKKHALSENGKRDLNLKKRGIR